jgi:UDP-N-acetylmuramoyl-tripeptide--D-alanyl-D-alanine ligase
VPLDDVTAVASRLRPADRRGAVRQLRGPVTLIDDSYNSSPSALRRALEVVAHESHAARKVAVLGEMLELGDASGSGHHDVGVAAAATVDLLVTVGGGAKGIAAGAREAGLVPSRILETRDRDAALDVLTRHLRDGDVVLVKASRGIELDRIVDALRVQLAKSR